MQRRLYRAVLKAGKEQEAIEKLMKAKQKLEELVDNRNIEYPSLFRFGNQVFLYFEFSNLEAHPDNIFIEASEYLEPWPSFEGFRQWVLMHDIFHYQLPQNPEEWRRKTKVERPVGRVIRLKPEMIASYIFYHNQYQEEKPCDGDKFGIIGIHEDLLFFYCEEPTYQEKPSYAGMLSTKNTPSNWGELMGKHFKAWANMKNAEDNWRAAKVIFTTYTMDM